MKNEHIKINKKNTRFYLSEIAKEKAKIPFHGYLNGIDSNIEPIIRLFPKWNVKDADRTWCAAFVYYCLVEAGFDIPYSPDECITCSLAGCGGWEEYAMGDHRIEYHKRGDGFIPDTGDIVLYDRVTSNCNCEHDHIGILLKVNGDNITVAEGNAFDTNESRIVKRPIDDHIRAFIRIPDGYSYYPVSSKK